MDRAVDPASTEQRAVGRVHDRIDLLTGDVAFDDLNSVDGAHRRKTSEPRQDVVVGENDGSASGVDEDDGLVFSDVPLTDLTDEAGHRFSGVNRIEEDTFGAGDELDGFECRIGRLPVSLADVVVTYREVVL